MNRVSKGSMIRKNGRPSSCEPCRISKIKCDNRRPICRRCETRCLSTKCYYHPAPMTKLNKDLTRNPTRHNKTKDIQIPMNQEPSQSTQSDLSDGATDSTAHSTYFGSTSFLSVFCETQPSISPTPVPHPVLRGGWSCDHASVASRLVQLLSARTCVEVNKAITRLLDDSLNYRPSSLPTPSEDRKGDGPVEERSCDSIIQWENAGDVPDPASFGTSTDFLSWLDDLGFETSLPEFLL
ncbi:hypothetical protein BDV28DRAFT_101392 [Aspergillus coremiiformis]|uniref:Zn(2)-C6 fungal-type domain-containing protein n=1 Tax=Aspergillus coremiiformis TaxID=138285 RepID=A0A5N6Z7T4_9EURO|nr:hypothetical protein BDV28DRAFT_101392 [Aspergillus coremiiformis]